MLSLCHIKFTNYQRDSEEELGDALIYLTTGVGGDDSSDWTSMLKQMYEKWGELKGHEGIHFLFCLYVQLTYNWCLIVNEIEVSEATHGIRNACIQICGENVYGLLKVLLFSLFFRLITNNY